MKYIEVINQPTEFFSLSAAPEKPPHPIFYAMALTDASVQRVASGLNDGLQDGDLAIRVAAFADTPKAPPRHCSYCSWLRYVRIPCRSVDTCRYVADVSNCI